MADKKITKVEYFDMIRSIVAESDAENVTELLNFIDTQVEQIAAKAEKAKSRAAEKKAAGDELRDAIYAVMTDDYQDIDTIMAQIDGEDLTRAKISARITQLIKAEMVEKESQKNSEGKKCMMYRRIDK